MARKESGFGPIFGAENELVTLKITGMNANLGLTISTFCRIHRF
jgi:hypothetical protein